MNETRAATSIGVLHGSLHNHQTTVQDLPTETLLMIFQCLFWTSGVEPTCSCANPDECFCGRSDSARMALSHEDLLKASPSPHATSLVCKRWNALMRSVPSFWTLIVIVLDEDPKPLLKMQSQIDMSGDLLLDVHILRRQKIRDPGERARSGPIIDFLIPHLHRCRVIVFDLMHNSSLPSLSRDFRLMTHRLVKLQLRSQIDDGQEYMARPMPSDPDGGCSFLSSLEILDIDGKNFADCCLDEIYWVIFPHPTTKKRAVTVANYTPISNEVDEQCTMWDFLAALALISNVSELHLVNLEFPVGMDDLMIIETPYLELKDLDQPFIINFFECTQLSGLQYLHLTQCRLRTYYLRYIPSHLTLEHIVQDDDALNFLMGWNGTTLEVINMASFDDGAIRALHGYKGPEEVNTPRRRNFIIRDCPNFTVPTLKQFMISRNEALLQNFTDWIPPPRCALDVSGYGPVLPDEDREWFDASLDSFQWNTHQHNL